MNLSASYASLKSRLANVVDTPELEARWLLQHFLGVDDAAILDGTAVVEVPEALENAVQQRLAGKPLSKIIGWRDFYGRRFQVNDHVLDPRPDSETLIEAAIPLLRAKPNATILDCGVGSGCLILTLLAEHQTAYGTGLDLSDTALATTAANAKALNLSHRLNLIRSDWLNNLPAQAFDLIISNPPYIEQADIAGLDKAVRNHDPHVALDGGSDGLDAYRTLLGTLPPYCTRQTDLLFEIGAGQAPDIIEIAAKNRFKLKASHADLGGHIRVLHFLLA